MTELRATYRLQLGGEFGFAAGARARAVPARPRRLAPLPAAVVPGARRARRTATTSSTRRSISRRARRRGGVRRARRARCSEAGHGDRARHRPQPHGDRRREPLLDRPGAARAVLRHRPGDRPPPALLRHRPPRRRAPGGPGGVRGDARAGAAAGARGRGRRAADRPSRRARRPRRLPASGCATAASSTCGWRRSSTPASSCATGRSTGTVGYEFLNDVAALFVDPAGEAPLTDAVGRGLGRRRGRFAELAFEAKLEQARDDVRAGGRAAAARGAASASAGAGARARLAARLPHLRRAVVGRVEDEDREAVAEAGLPASLARCCCSRRRGWDAFVTRFQQTTPPVMAKGVEDTAFYRYARLLALNDVGGDPARFGLSVERLPRRPTPSAPRASRATCSSPRRTTPSAPATCARGSARSPAMADEWAAHVRALARGCRVARRPAARRRRSSSYFIFQTLRRRVADRAASGSRPTSRRRCARPSARRTGSTPNEEHEAAVKASARALLRRTATSCADFEPFAARGRRGGRPRRARPAAAQADRARACPTSTRATSCSRSRSSTPTTAARSTGSASAALAALRAAPSRRPTRKLRLIGARWRCARGGRTRSRAPTSRSTPGRTPCAFVRGGEVLAAARVRGADERRRCRLPGGRWRDVLGPRHLARRRHLHPNFVWEHGVALLARIHRKASVARTRHRVLLATVAAFLVAAAPASAALPVVYNGVARLRPRRARPRARPARTTGRASRARAHPRPVVLVHGTFADMADSWQALSPLLANNGYCVFALNYGCSTAAAHRHLRDRRDRRSAGQLAASSTRCCAATGAAKVDLVGHSQGGMMPRYYLQVPRRRGQGRTRSSASRRPTTARRSTGSPRSPASSPARPASRRALPGLRGAGRRLGVPDRRSTPAATPCPAWTTR